MPSFSNALIQPAMATFTILLQLWVCLFWLGTLPVLALTGSSGNSSRPVRVSHLDSSRLAGYCRCHVPFLAATILLSRSYVATSAEQPESPDRCEDPVGLVFVSLLAEIQVSFV